MREQQERFGSEWIRLYSGELSAGDLAAATRWATATVRTAPPDLAGLDWESLARQTHAVYETLLADGQPVRRSGTSPLVRMAPPELTEDQAHFKRGGDELRKLHPPFFWRYLAQRAFHRAHPEAPLIVANAVILLDSWIKPSDRGLEWGSGRSTGWLAARLDHPVTIEHDQVWYDRVGARIAARQPGRQGRLPADPGTRGADGGAAGGATYAGVADEVADQSLDLVLIDGQMRLRCMREGPG